MVSRNGSRWSREENLLALNLYFTVPFGRIDRRNPDIVDLANLLGRSPNSVAIKLANFASLDPDLRERGIRGMSHRSAADEAIWHEFVTNREALSFESERLRAELIGIDVEEAIPIEDAPELIGVEREAIVRVRVNQHYFRRMMLSRYDARCCITGLALRALLVGSHIVPWSAVSEERMNPSNGLCLNALHDRAFDAGLLSISDDLRVIVAKAARTDSSLAAAELLLRYEGEPLKLPDGIAPGREQLAYHRAHVFLG